MPSSTGRRSARGRPVGCGGYASLISGSMRSQSASGTSQIVSGDFAFLRLLHPVGFLRTSVRHSGHGWAWGGHGTWAWLGMVGMGSHLLCDIPVKAFFVRGRRRRSSADRVQPAIRVVFTTVKRSVVGATGRRGLRHAVAGHRRAAQRAGVGRRLRRPVSPCEGSTHAIPDSQGFALGWSLSALRAEDVAPSARRRHRGREHTQKPRKDASSAPSKPGPLCSSSCP